jgi:hypothetical protein
MSVYCPKCENECSEEAVSCPKCGHPLKKTGHRSGIIAVGLAVVLAICVGIIVLQIREDAADVKEEVGKPEEDYVRAMREAASALDSMASWDEELVDYQAALGKGRAVIKVDRWSRDMTMTFAERLPAEDRERWLRECLAALMVEIDKRSHDTWLARTRIAFELEAIYSLAGDMEVKNAAYGRWNELERRFYEDEMDKYQRGVPRPSGARRQKPHMRRIRVWDTRSGTEKKPN